MHRQAKRQATKATTSKQKPTQFQFKQTTKIKLSSKPQKQRLQQQILPFSTTTTTPPPSNTLTFTVVGPNGYKKEITTPPGRGLRQVLQASKVSMLPAVCNGQLQCSTCHIKLQPALYYALPPPDLPEQDILDISADYQQDCSRLACQLQITKVFNGKEITIPEHFINHMDDPTGTPVKSSILADV